MLECLLVVWLVGVVFGGLSTDALFCRQPNIANVAVRKQFQRLLEFIREGKLHSVSGTVCL